MDMSVPQHSWCRELAPTALAFIMQEEPTIYAQKGSLYLGACNSVNWKQLDSVADATVHLAAAVLECTVNNFVTSHGFVEEGDRLHVRYGVHVDFLGTNIANRAMFQQALSPFLQGILDGDKYTQDMFPRAQLTEALKNKVDEQIAETLFRLKGKKIKTPLAVFADGLTLGLAGRFAEAPPQEIDRTPFEVIGRIEGIERPKRKFTILVPGVRERLQQINFDLDRYLDTFRAILCDDQAYRFMVHIELNAKGKPMAVVDSVSRLDDAPFHLTSKPTKGMATRPLRK